MRENFMVEEVSMINFDAWKGFQHMKKENGKKGILLMKEGEQKCSGRKVQDLLVK